MKSSLTKLVQKYSWIWFCLVWMDVFLDFCFCFVCFFLKKIPGHRKSDVVVVVIVAL